MDKLFGGKREAKKEELRLARERHGIEVDEEEEAEEEKGAIKKSNWEVDTGPYDPWEDLKDLRTSFWIGGWAAKRLRWRPANDKLREELEEVARKREEKAQKQLEEAEARGDTKMAAQIRKGMEKRAERDKKALDMVEDHSDSGLRAELEAAARKREAKEREKAAKKRAKEN